MSPLTTLLVVALSLSALVLYASKRRISRALIKTVIPIVALVGALAGALTILRAAAGWNIPLEQWLSRIPLFASDTPLRPMPVATGVGCTLAAVALSLIALSSLGARPRKVAQFLSCTLCAWAALCGVAMLAGRPHWFLNYTPMAPSTILALLLLGAGLWAVASTRYQKKEGEPLSPWLAFLVASIALGAITAQHIRSHKQDVLQSTRTLLTAVSDLKVEQVANWRKERISDARILGSTRATAEVISSFLNAQTPATRAAAAELFTAATATDVYESVTIFDANLNPMFALGEDGLTTASPDRDAIAIARTTHSTQMGDIYWNQLANAPRINVVTPIFSLDDSNSFRGVLQLSIDPRETLFPLLAGWPVPTTTADTLLWLCEEDNITLLYSSHTNASLQHPFRLAIEESPGSPIVRAIRDGSSVAVRRDFRGIPVFAGARPVPGTSWFLVAKIDAEEVFTPLLMHASMAAWFTALLSLVTGLGTRLFQTRRELLTRKALASEVTRRHLLANTSRDGIVIMNTRGAVVEANESFARMLGYSMKQLSTMHVWDWDAQMDRAQLERDVANSSKDGEVFETRHRRADGSVMDVQISASGATIEGERLILAICRDITAHKKAEAELIKREHRFRTLFNLAPFGILVTDMDGVILNVNEAFCAIHGVTRDQILHQNTKMFIPKEFHARRPDDLAALRNGQLLHHQSTYVRADGTTISLLVEEIAIDLADGTSGILTFVDDITIRKQAEEQLRESEERFRSTLDLMADGSVIVGFDERVLYANEAIARQVGMTKDALIGKQMGDVVPELEGTPLFKLFRDCLQNRTSARIENKHATPEGKPRWYSMTIQPVPEGFFMLSVDITDQRAAEEHMRLQSTALNAAANAFVITDRRGVIEWANNAFCRASGFGLEEARGKNPRELIKSGTQDKEFYRTMWGTILSGNVWRGEIVNRRKDGTIYTEDMTITPVKDGDGQIQHFIAIKQDITAQKQLEEQLLRTQRLESVGRLASGIAHDLNNTLSPILLSPALLREGITDPTLLEVVDSIETSATRGASIIRQLLAFSRGLEPKRIPIQLGPIIHDVEKLVAPIFPKTISIKLNIPTEPLWVTGDATQLHQAITNLCINGRDAMPKGGTLTISLSSSNVDQARAKQYEGVKPGIFATLSVRDTGTGIHPDHLKTIFDPFFTTKGVGEGTGLGLSTVLGIARGHNGFIEVTSAVEQGSEFRVYIPLYLERTNDIPKNISVESSLRGNGETVLVVDDEESIRKLACRILEKNGYRTLEAEHGQAALAVLKSETTPVSVLLTDMLMPVMDGITLIRTLRESGSKIKMIAMSGYLSDLSAIMSGKFAPDAFIPKPFTPKILTQTLRTALAGQTQDTKQ